MSKTIGVLALLSLLLLAACAAPATPVAPDQVVPAQGSGPEVTVFRSPT